MTERPIDYAAQFAADQGVELTLPSSAVVLVRNPDVLQMAMDGLIPDTLSPVVERFIFEREKTLNAVNGKRRDEDGTLVDAEQAPGERLRGYSEFLKYVDCVVVGACLDPVVRFKPKAKEIAPSQIPTADRIAIWSWAEGLSGALGAAFPDGGGGSDAGVQPVADGEEPGAAPERADQPDAAV